MKMLGHKGHFKGLKHSLQLFQVYTADAQATPN